MRTPVFGLAATGYDSGCRQPPHAHDELQITLVLRGVLEEKVGATAERASALSVVVKDPGVTHADEFGRAGTLTARLWLRDTTIAELVEHPLRARAWQWMHGAPASRPFLRLVSRFARGERRFEPGDDDVLDVLAAVSARRASVQATDPPGWLVRVVEEIRDGWHPRLRVRDLAGEAGVHPVYLARCVRRWYGAGAADLLRKARFRHAARVIAEDGRRITVASVAYATGFSDEAHLSREFSRRAGLPPARYRRLMGELGFGNSSFGGRATVPFAHGQIERGHAASMGVGCSAARRLGDSAARD